MENWADLWVTVWKLYWVCQTNRTNKSSFCLIATQVVLLQKTILIWDGRNHLSVTLLIWKRQPRYTAEEGFLHESQPIGVHFCWVMQWWHLLGLIKSLLKSICWRQSTAAAGLTVIPDTTTEKNQDLIAILPVQTPDEYYVPMWRLIPNKELGWCCFTQAFS